jgi:hypothetical protein
MGTKFHGFINQRSHHWGAKNPVAIKKMILASKSGIPPSNKS